jgi:tRNA modification GTPase
MAARARCEEGLIGVETIVAPISATGPAPRGIVRLSGPDAFAIAARCFVPDVPGPPSAGPRTGAFVLDGRGTTCRAELWGFAAPRSYTGDDVVECHVFGAPKLLDLVMGRLVGAGARVAEPGEFTRRALLNGKVDLTRAEAVLALIRARDADEHRRARSLLDGGMASAVATFADRLVALLVPIELSLDFSDSDVVLAPDPDRAARLLALAADLAAFGASSRPEARRMLARVVLRGPANAGKSSLFNALLRSDVAIAAPERGTTRDVLCAEWRHGDVRALLVDTAGDDVSGSPVDDLARDARERALLEADLVLEVRDLSRGGWPAPEPGTLRVGTMSDLPGRGAPIAGVAPVSNVTGAGLDALADRIATELAASSARRAAPFLVTARQASHLLRARAAIERGAAISATHPPELVASDLRDALRELRAVLGADEGDPVLDRIFRDFCIGK